jgi:hypothetical protein
MAIGGWTDGGARERAVHYRVRPAGRARRTALGRYRPVFGEQSPKVEAHVTYRLPFQSGAVHNQASLEDLDGYAELITEPHGSVWMDNTTLVTADMLLSDTGSRVMTPLTVWDLVTFFRAIVL